MCILGSILGMYPCLLGVGTVGRYYNKKNVYGVYVGTYLQKTILVCRCKHRGRKLCLCRYVNIGIIYYILYLRLSSGFGKQYNSVIIFGCTKTARP